MTTKPHQQHQIREVKWTTHARKRGQQRGISQDAVQAALWFGDRFWAGDGCVAYYLGRKVMRRVGVEISRTLEQYRDIAVIVASDGALVSVQHTPRPKRRWRR